MTGGTPRLGLRANWRQFWLLVLINAFVGAMVGLERTVLPLIAEREFGLASKGAALSFIVTFGLTKALANLAAGWFSERVGRKRVLVAGWLAALPVPFLIMWAPAWSWVVFANVLLGVNQGLAWSTTVVMKIDLVGPERRGFAMGLNEFAGYLAVAVSAFATGAIATRYGLRPEPFYLGIAFAALGLALSLLFVRDTTAHATAESRNRDAELGIPHLSRPERRGVGEVFAQASWRNPALSSASQAGLVNNLNDGLAWGLFPLYFAAAGLPLRQISILVALYPATWGLAQLWTGALSDRWGRKGLITWGMHVQGAALLAMALLPGFLPWAAGAVTLGVGTAMVYPTLLAAVGDVAHPSWRASAVGVYRLWRDLGYAVGAVVAGVLADTLGMSAAIGVIGLLTIGSGVLVVVRMPETLRAIRRGSARRVQGGGRATTNQGEEAMITTQRTTPGPDANSVRKVVSVKVTPAVAWQVFTEEMRTWWPLATYKISKANAVDAVIEPRVGGRWYERGDDRSTCDWGRVLSWEPPSRLVLSWEITADWQHDPAVRTEVEVRFIAEGSDGTRVELEHRHLDRFGARREEMRAIFDSEGGWGALLESFVRTASA